jgi:hypothetical protein
MADANRIGVDGKDDGNGLGSACRAGLICVEDAQKITSTFIRASPARELQ